MIIGNPCLIITFFYVFCTKYSPTPPDKNVLNVKCFKWNSRNSEISLLRNRLDHICHCRIYSELVYSLLFAIENLVTFWDRVKIMQTHGQMLRAKQSGNNIKAECSNTVYKVSVSSQKYRFSGCTIFLTRNGRGMQLFITRDYSLLQLLPIV